MPIYEYKCQKCGTFEITQRITEKPLAKCPKCKAKVKKLISNTSFQLKGTGWYVTDYARKGKNGESKGDGKGESSAKPAGDSKSESKSDSKNESKKSESSASSSDKSASTTSTAST